MYKCDNCRHLFSDPITVKTETGRVCGCPWCGVDDLTEVELCEDCGRPFDPHDIYGGYCMDCLKASIDYPAALNYLLARDHLREFLAMVDGKTAENATRSGLIQAFIAHEADDRRRGVEYFLDQCRIYIVDDGVCARDFAEWREGAE